MNGIQKYRRLSLRGKRVVTWMLFALILLAGAALRLWMLRTGRVLFDSDQAVEPIGALRILRGHTYHLIWPGQNYGGTLGMFYFVPWHIVFAPSPGLARIAMIPVLWLIGGGMFCCIMVMTRNRAWALCATALVMLPPSFVAHYLTRSLLLYPMPLIAALLGGGLLWRIVRRTGCRGWTGGDLLRGFFLGLALGLAVWTHAIAFVYIAAMMALLLLFPAGLLRFCGITVPRPIRSASITLQAASVCIQLLMMALLCALGWMLLFVGNETSGELFRARLFWLKAALACAAVALVVRVVFSMMFERAALASRLGIAACAAGAGLGALPLIWHVWIDRSPTMQINHTVSGTVFWKQLLSVFNSGIPVLLGFYNNFKTDVPGVPLWARGMAMSVWWICLAALVFHAVKGRRIRRPSSAAACYFLLLGAATIMMFSLSTWGNFIDEPRYVIILYFVFASAAGCVFQLMRRGGGAPALIAPVMVALLVAFNIISCMSLPQADVAGWSGALSAEKALISSLKAKGKNRVSCRLVPDGYWSAYRLTYIADERVVFAPARRPDNVYNRSERYQRAVDNATDIAYLVTSSEEPTVVKYLVAAGSRYEMFRAACFCVFHNVAPDALRSTSWEQIRRGK
ncbi:MAG: hypothetical protein NTY46_11135 [Candidatus Sumerlaeota bacterium]|nr:hypothetical protein [Candidatus Sumerlaeota bacterium]